MHDKWALAHTVLRLSATSIIAAPDLKPRQMWEEWIRGAGPCHIDERLCVAAYDVMFYYRGRKCDKVAASGGEPVLFKLFHAHSKRITCTWKIFSRCWLVPPILVWQFELCMLVKMFCHNAVCTPQWVSWLVNTVGLKCISNMVDFTNYAVFIDLLPTGCKEKRMQH